MENRFLLHLMAYRWLIYLETFLKPVTKMKKNSSFCNFTCLYFGRRLNYTKRKIEKFYETDLLLLFQKATRGRISICIVRRNVVPNGDKNYLTKVEMDWEDHNLYFLRE